MKNPEFILQPVTDKSGVVLLDIYVGSVAPENWIGSRRTFKACEKFLGLDKPKRQD